MATQAVRPVSQLAQVDSLLDSFIFSQEYVPGTAYRIEYRNELPRRLQLRARQVRHGTWRAWTDGQRIWFVVAKLVPDISREVNRHALHVSFMDMDGRLASCGVWTQSGDARWVLYNVDP